MLILSDRLINTSLLSLQTGSQIAKTSEPIIDPRQLHVEAFYCEGAMLDHHPSVVFSNDIRELSDIGMIIDSSEDLMDPEGLVRLEEIIGFDFKIIGLKVVTDKKQHLGVVANYATNAMTFMISKIIVKRPFLRSLALSELVIDRSQIIEVTNARIVVKSATVKNQAAPALQTSSYVNPFRTQNPEHGL